MKGSACTGWCFCNHCFCAIVLFLLVTTLCFDAIHLFGNLAGHGGVLGDARPHHVANGRPSQVVARAALEPGALIMSSRAGGLSGGDASG